MKIKKYVSIVGIIALFISNMGYAFANDLVNSEKQSRKEVNITGDKTTEQTLIENNEFDEALNLYISDKYNDKSDSERIDVKNKIIKYIESVGVGYSNIASFYECVDIARKIDEYINNNNLNNEEKINYIIENYNDILEKTDLSEYEIQERILSLIPEENNENIIFKVNDLLDTDIVLRKNMNSRYANYSYNESTAISYAKKYNKSFNSKYPRFSADCANFVSQSIHEGGVSEIKGSVSANSSWFCDTNDANNLSKISSTWRGAQAFRWHWGERAKGGMKVVYKKDFDTKNEFINNVYNKAYKGDAISLVNSQGMAFHTIIVTDRNTSNKSMKYAAHSDSGNGDLESRIKTSAVNYIRIYGI